MPCSAEEKLKYSYLPGSCVNYWPAPATAPASKLTQGLGHVSSRRLMQIDRPSSADCSPMLLTALRGVQAKKRALVSAILERSAAQLADAAGPMSVSLSTAHLHVVAGATTSSDVSIHNAGRAAAVFSVCAAPTDVRSAGLWVKQGSSVVHRPAAHQHTLCRA